MRKISRLAALLCAACLLSGCSARAANPRPEEPTEPPEPVEYVVVDPPTGGWTTKELMSVTYFCDRRLRYPLAVKDLGEDFSLGSYDPLFIKFHLEPVMLRYKGQNFANLTAIKPKQDIMIYNAVLTPQLCEVEGTEPFVINGVKMYDSYDDVLAALGDDYRYKSDTGISYNDRETGEDLCSLFFEDGKLVHFNYSFRFDTGL